MSNTTLASAPWTIPPVEPTEDPAYYRTINPCDNTCHNPVHAFNHPERMRHLVEADLAKTALASGWIE